KGTIGGAMQTPPAGLWGLPPEILQTLPGYGPDVEKNRAEARKLMEKLGYGPQKRLAVQVQTRNIAQYRDPAVILIDQMKQIYIDGELDVVETANWFPKIARKDYTIAGNLTGSGVDDPWLDQWRRASLFSGGARLVLFRGGCWARREDRDCVVVPFRFSDGAAIDQNVREDLRLDAQSANMTADR